MSDPAPPGEIELRDTLVSDYQRYARSRGADPPIAALEALAVGDLEITDRVEAETRARPAGKPAQPEPPAEPGAAAKLAEARGYRFERKELPRVEARPDLAPLFEKPRALARRIQQICAREPGAPRTLSIADQLFVYPKLAKAALTEMADFKFRRRRYRGLSDTDRQRAFWRAMEDIADRSTGALGPWWVK